MDIKLFLKTIFVLAILSLLVLMGMNNLQKVDLKLPPILKEKQTFPAALMYFGFFGVGVLTGTILNAGGKKSSGKTSKVER